VKSGFGFPVLGVARAAIADTIEYATSHPMSVGGLLRSETPGNTFAIADAAMLVESAHAFLLQEARLFYAKALQDEPFT
jgi:alkylation response protein AidB-like acyl-CoA dehydrogenase